MSWIQTYTGRKFDLLAPPAADVCIEDIAHALSLLCRFSGHVREFYSVAQHAVLVARCVAPEHRMAALLHDAAEAYCADLPRPLKHLPDLAGYRAAEQRVWLAVAERFGLHPELPAEVKRFDQVLLMTEQRDLLGPQIEPWENAVEPLSWKILPCSPERAEQVFLDHFKMWQPRGYGR